jgi:ribosomal-protein-alanine N-acetyltransferase
MKRVPLPDIINTARLVLRPYSLGDVDAVFSYAADEEWGRYLPLPWPYVRKDAERFIAGQILMDRTVHPSWAIVFKNSVIGGINIRFNFENRLAEMGYSIARHYWRQGFASEAAQAVVESAFRVHPDLNRIRAMTDLKNVASQRVLEKVGMSKEGILRQNRIVHEEFVDEVWFGLLRNEWRG